MVTPVHLIHFDLESDAPQVIFKADYRPTTGPLPELSYKLIGLWTHEDIVIRALFEAPQIPTQNGELILHRYEGATIAHQGQASYRYFTAANHAGMMLTNKAFSKKLGVPVEAMWASFSTTLNQKSADEFILNNPEGLLVCTAVDRLGKLPPIVFAVASPQERLSESSALETQDSTPVPAA